MSDMRTVVAVRVCLGDYESYNALYNHLIRDLGFVDSDFEEVEYESEWIPEEKRYEETDIVEYFKLKEYHIVSDDKNFYADIRISDEYQSDSLSVSLSVDEINQYVNKLNKRFDGNYEARLVAYDWYTGCDEPVYF